MTRLALLLVLLSGCAASPTLDGPPATRADLNAAPFGEVVTLRHADGSHVEEARAVIVTPDVVRFNEDRGAPTTELCWAFCPAWVSLPSWAALTAP